MYGDALDGGAESAVLPFGIEEVKLAKLKKESAKLIFPTTCEDTDHGVYYDMDWEAEPVERMSFTNTYTESTNEPNSPGTGDDGNLLLWGVLLAASTCGVIGTAVYCKRKRAN